MIKTQTCITIVCDGCETEYEHDYTPHYPNADMARQQTGYEEWVSDDDKIDLCPGCKVAPHPFRLKPDTTDECWRCDQPFEEHEPEVVTAGALPSDSGDRS